MRYSDFTPYDIILLLEGLSVTLGLFLLTTFLGLVLGVAFAVTKFYRPMLIHTLLSAIVELLKNSPVLVQLFLVFFGIPAFLRVDITPVEAATITLSLNTAAFSFVILYAGIQSIDKDQIETASVFGLRRDQILRYIIARPAIAYSVAPLVGLMVNQLQVTSLISVIGVMDLTKIGHILNNRTLEPFVVWTAIGVIYYICAKILTLLGNRLELKLRASTATGEV